MQVSFDGSADSVTVPKVVSDLFSHGVLALFRNYEAGRGHSDPAGISALCDEETFLGAVRGLTDEIYAAAGTERVIDASPGNAAVEDLIARVYGATPPRGAQTPRLVAPVFVVGVPRSGTTWVQNMLLAHPQLDGPRVETAVFVSLQPLWNNAALREWISRDALAAAMRGFVATLFADYGPRLVEKTPLHGEHLELINAVCPDASVISVHRDGRDVVRSLLEMESGTDDVVVAATRWAEITRDISAALSSLPHARDMRYESMLDDPVGAISDVFEWLGLPVDDTITAEVRRRAEERVSQYNTTGDVGPGKWRTLSRRQLRVVYRHAGDRLEELGYR
ncbi:MAG: hypothetical protein QOK28_1232 [Actinomycetota bacterium]